MSDTLLPDNATAQEIALDLATSRIGDVAVDIRAVMNPQACPAHLLPWLAWALSVDEWDTEWTEATKRAAVAASVGVHRRKGTRAAVRAAIAAAGYGDAELVERFGYNFYDGARRHNGGNDNYAAGADDMANPTLWPTPMTQNGITSTKTIVTRADGLPAAQYRFQGTATNSFAAGNIYASTLSRAPVTAGQVMSASCIARFVAGSLAGVQGLRTQVSEDNAAGAYIGDTKSGMLTADTDTVLTATRQQTTGAGMRPSFQLAITNGAVIDVTFEIAGFQFELAAARTEITPYDFNYGMPDHWAEYRLNLARPITIAQAAQVRRIAEGVAPLRSRLKLLTYTAAQHLYDGTIQNDGTFAHGAA